MKNKRIFSLVTCLCLAIPAVFAQFNFNLPKTKNAAPIPSLQRVLTIQDMVHEYDLNPYTASYNSEAQLFTALYEGLFSYDPITLDPVNAICETYKISRNKMRWTFTLRKGLKFSDGSPLNASAIRNSWLSLLATKNAPFASLIDCIEGAEAYRTGKGSADDVRIIVRDEETLVVHLTEPTEHFPRILCHHAFSAVSKKKNVFSGPFVISSYSNGELKMVKNMNYRDAAAVQLPGITIRQGDDAKENAHLFNTGEADWVTGDVEVEKILNKDSINIAGEFGTTFLFFKQSKKIWNTQEFRTALLEAVPYDELRKDYAVKANSLVYPLSGYPSVIGWDDYDPEDALELMNIARKKVGLSSSDILKINFSIMDLDYMKSWTEVLKKAWAPLGVELVVSVDGNFTTYVNKIKNSPADLFMYSWIGDFADPTTFLELFRSNSTLNVSGYKNSRYDELLKQAAGTAKQKDRFAILAEAEQVILDDAEIIPISHPVCMHVINTNVIGGWKSNALDIHPFKYLYIKAEETDVPNLVSYPLPPLPEKGRLPSSRL